MTVKECLTITKFYDTNALLNLQEAAFKERFFISDETLREIENIKTSSRKDEDIKYKARHIARLLDQNHDQYSVINYNFEMEKQLLNFELDPVRPDNRIVFSAYTLSKAQDIEFISDDLCCKNIARKVFNLPVYGIVEPTNEIYKGYKVIKGDTNAINQAMAELDYSTWHINEYLIIENTDDGTTKEMRYDGQGFVALKLPSSKFIKAKNSLQRCALDILNNPDITIAAILGGYGSGKTYLSMQMALYNVKEKGRNSKILGVREVSGEGKEIGFLPGDMEDKVGRFFEPLSQSLNGGEFELQSLKVSGVLDTNVPFFMKGTTYNDTVILCDEAEDLSESQIKLIGTRLGENSKIYLAGDYKQSLLSKTINNPLIKMCNEFKGNEKFGCIYLGEDVRSETSKLFADLFEKDHF
ncbi:PhoH family protein [Blautia wexlerae]|nr:PhoH family protein [Blautia wexlerae]